MGEEVTAVALDEIFPRYERFLTDWTLPVLLDELGGEESVDVAETALSVQVSGHCSPDSLFAGNGVEELGDEASLGSGQARSLRTISLEVKKCARNKVRQRKSTQRLMIYLLYRTLQVESGI